MLVLATQHPSCRGIAAFLAFMLMPYDAGNGSALVNNLHGEELKRYNELLSKHNTGKELNGFEQNELQDLLDKKYPNGPQSGPLQEVNFDLYRGGEEVEAFDKDIRIDKATVMVKPTRGISTNIDPEKVKRFGGTYKIESIPFGLKLFHTGNGHYEIIPAMEMTRKEYQRLLNNIKLIK